MCELVAGIVVDIPLHLLASASARRRSGSFCAACANVRVVQLSSRPSFHVVLPCADQWCPSTEEADYLTIALSIHTRVLAAQPSGMWLTDDDPAIADGALVAPAPPLPSAEVEPSSVVVVEERNSDGDGDDDDVGEGDAVSKATSRTTRVSRHISAWSVHGCIIKRRSCLLS